jgi:hypothetical protein
MRLTEHAQQDGLQSILTSKSHHEVFHQCSMV